MSEQRKIALVTGGSRGLGRNMAIQLARSGVDVIITYNSREDEASVVCGECEDLGRRAASLQLDVSAISSFPGFGEQLNRCLSEQFQVDSFDFLVNNAGINVHTMFGQTTEEEFDSLMNVHFKGVYFLTQELLPQLRDGGSIVCVSTGLTRFAIPGYGAYAAMKGGLEVFIKYLAKELGPRRITANIVAPGAIETDFTRGAFEHNPDLKGFIASQTALGRVGLPEDIGGVVTFLCSEPGHWVNAQRIEASGGMFL